MACWRCLAARRLLLPLLLLAVATLTTAPARAQDLPEYRLKAAFLYNFVAFTEWPAEVGGTLNLCILGADPFGAEIDPLAGKKVGERALSVQRKAAAESLKGCHVVFIAAPAMVQWTRVRELLRGQPALTVADSAGAVRQGVALNMTVSQGRVAFEANLGSARAAGLNLSSRLLRLATEVVQ